jgi:hypothetical protein
MVKHQIHETFKTFDGTSIPEVSKAVSDFVDHYGLAPKSLSVLIHNAKVVMTIGYRSDEAGYHVGIETVNLSEMETGPLDDKLSKAEKSVPGDVICHSLFVNRDGELEVAFLLHE